MVPNMFDLEDRMRNKIAEARWAALPFLIAGACFPVMDFFSISMLLPTVRTALNATAVEAQLVSSVFSAVYAVFLITGSRLGDLFGRRRLFIVGGLVFSAASLLGALAPSIGWLIAARALQGASAALFAPQVLATIQALFEGEERALVIRRLGTSFAAAGVIGLVGVGALIAWHPFGLTWQTMFLAYAPAAAIIVLGALRIPESKNPHAQGLDPLGVGLLFVALGLLVVPLAAGRAAGWPLWSFLLLGLSPVGWFLLLRWQSALTRRGGSPLVALELFRDSVLVRGLVLSFLLYVSYGFLFCLALFLQGTRHLSAWELGLANLPMGLAFFASTFAVRTVSRWMGNGILVLGFALLGTGYAVIAASAILGDTGLGIAVGMVVTGLGNGLVIPSLLRVVTSGMEPRHAGLASGLLLSVQQMGGALGVVILGGVYFGVGAVAPQAGLAAAIGTAAALVLGAAALSATLRAPRPRPVETKVLAAAMLEEEISTGS
jgi:MFS family permease